VLSELHENPPGSDARIEALRRQAELGDLQAATQLYVELARRGMAPIPIWNRCQVFRAYLEEAISSLRMWSGNFQRDPGAIVVDNRRGQYSVRHRVDWPFRRAPETVELAFFHHRPPAVFAHDDGFFAAFLESPVTTSEERYVAVFLTMYTNQHAFRDVVSRKRNYYGKRLNFLYGLNPDAPVLESGRINSSWPRDDTGRLDMFNLVSDPTILTEWRRP